MKKFRNFISILLVCCLAVSLTLCAFAETVSDAKLIKTDDCELPGGDDSVITTGVYGEPMPFYVDFGSGEWVINGTTVTASIAGGALKGEVAISDSAVIKLDNFDSSKMQVKVCGENGFSVFLEVNGDNEVSLNRTETECALPMNLTFVVEGFDEQQHHQDDNTDGEGSETQRAFSVTFGSASWEIGDVTVTATMEDKDLTKGAITVYDFDAIKLINFDGAKMQVRVFAEDGFSAFLEPNGENEVSLGRPIGDFHLPDTLTFTVEPFDEEQHGPDDHGENGVYTVDFVNASWEVCGVTVTATYGDVDLQVGPVEIRADEPIILTNFDNEKMIVRVYGENDFSTLLEVLENGQVFIDRTKGGFRIPPEVFFTVEERPENPYPIPDGIEISFADSKEHHYDYSVIDYMNMKPEGIREKGFESEEEYEGTKAFLKELFSDTGDLLYLFELEVIEDGIWLYEGPFTFSIPITNEIEDGDYWAFKFTRIGRDSETGEFFSDGVINFDFENNKLICTIPTTGVYAFTATNKPLIKGDINSDGEVSIIDVVMARAHIVGNSILNLNQIADGDMNADNAIDIIDVAMMRNAIINA